MRLRNRVLILEDDQDLGFVLRKQLEKKGYHVRVANEGKTGLEMFFENKEGLMLLDINVPGINGLEVLRQIREESYSKPVIVITGNTDKSTKTASYAGGATIFHPKPIDFDLLEIQVDAQLKIHYGKDSLAFKDAVLDLEQQLLSYQGQRIELSYKEFALIALLMRNPSKIFTREQIIRHTYKGVYEPQSSSVDTLISRLRNKIDESDKDALIETIHGRGFSFSSKLAG